MEKKEIQQIYERVKTNYQNFRDDEYSRKEWITILKDYDFNDVMDKLEQHMQNEQWGAYIPKPLNIVKYLVKVEDKGKDLMQELLFRCPRCGYVSILANYNKHISRHNSIDYIKSKEKILGRTFNEEKMWKLSEVDFNISYEKFIEALVDYVEDNDEKERLKKIIEAYYIKENKENETLE